MLRRHSSRRQPLDEFLNVRLQGAKSYDRIAGYFASSILEVAGEALMSVSGSIRLICNSSLSPTDVEVARAAQLAMRREWCESKPESLGDASKPQFQRLYDLIRSSKMEIRVLPDEAFGMIHGKAGVVRLADGTETSFLGSTNESLSAFRYNYELVWEDDSPEAVAWVQEEFDALWSSPHAVPLADFVVEDLGRLAQRKVISDLAKWREQPDPASAVVESPVYRKEVGLWEHQKHFVKLAFDAHRGPHGARFVLADEVGLGKTLQLAMAAQLMALVGDDPILILAPKPLLRQWQDELDLLLGLPSAVWDGGQWVDEGGITHAATGDDAIRQCPRRIGIVSTGLITRRTNVAEHLGNMRFECVILDEAHRARRRNMPVNNAYPPVQPNNLLAFLRHVSTRAKSLLLATATPVQLHAIEAFDLLDALAQGSDAVLGSVGSMWRNPSRSLGMLTGNSALPEEFHERWDWLRNPFPPASEGPDFQILRRSLSLQDDQAYAEGRTVESLRSSDRQRIDQGFLRFMEQHNPFIRTIVRRTREYLESTVDPSTGEPMLSPVAIRLHGESAADAINLPPFLNDAYGRAEKFCALLTQRANTGFFRTMLLRRIGSTMEAGRLTVERMLAGWTDLDDEEDDQQGQLGTLTAAERHQLQHLRAAMESNQSRDPKYAVARRLLVDEGWLEQGCIIFSQYFDSVWWLANQLSADLSSEPIGIYAGANRSGTIRHGVFEPKPRDVIKEAVRRHDLRLLLGTDAASEGLNLQRLGCLINLDLPWNPSRLEQRKGRIQRIGQLRSEVDIYNMRYAGSVEDRVHELLSERLEGISRLFGQLPDTLEDVWINVALGKREEAKRTIDAVPEQHPFELRYREVRPVDWESCASVLDSRTTRESLYRAWKYRQGLLG